MHEQVKAANDQLARLEQSYILLPAAGMLLAGVYVLELDGHIVGTVHHVKGDRWRPTCYHPSMTLRDRDTATAAALALVEEIEG